MTAITVVGEALVDIVPGRDSVQEIPGGSPANVALGLGRLGVPVDFLTWLGDDERGRRVEEHLVHSGVHLMAGSHSAPQTSTAQVELDAAGQAHYHFELSWDLASDVPADTGWIHTGSIGAFLQPGATKVLDAVERTKRAGGIVSFDPNIRPVLLPAHRLALGWFERLAASTTILKLSDEDAGWLYPGLSSGEVLDHLLARGVALAILTEGAKGSVLSTSQDRVTVASDCVPVVDTVGAGDTYMAALLWQLLSTADLPSSWSPQQLAEIGRTCARAAAITVGRQGADLPTLAELADAIDQPCYSPHS
ncbi:fructokinase [Propionibacterium cyclohexanicum]|uniref:Fructokinase n=1 Tax=Propionibacterium cyclohexanicum TaxID=64702 RepID=A0A1H9TKY2_9ACTN|nr:carbohydrate kinase [Propionibacterium cyclohexanicum]SER97644.1 fructokinase [Propionibacterium cyclohexanicum]